MQLTHATWCEVSAYLAQSKAIIVPIGSTEQHGPIGLIGTDALTATAVAHGIGELGHPITAGARRYRRRPGWLNWLAPFNGLAKHQVLGQIHHHQFGK